MRFFAPCGKRETFTTVTEEIEGVVQGVVFANDESGFSVVRLAVDGQAIIATGTMFHPAAGQTLRLKGAWTKHPKYGPQFRVDESVSVAPTTAEGIEGYRAEGI